MEGVCRILDGVCRILEGYVAAAASPHGAAEASPGRAVMASPSIGGESLRRRPEQLAWVDLHEITRGGGFQNNRVIETGRGGRKRGF